MGRRGEHGHEGPEESEPETAAVPPADTAADTRRQLMATLASMSPEERQNFAAMLGTIPIAGPQVVKLGQVLESIAPAKREKVSDALASCKMSEGDDAKFVAALGALRVLAPSLVTALEANSNRRHKPLGHSINVAIARLAVIKVRAKKEGN